MVHVFSLCWNEEILLPYYFNFYKSRFTNVKFTIYDNQSTDRSLEIMNNFGAEVLTFSTENQINDETYLRIKNNCWKNTDADWVIVCDVDELLDISESDLLECDFTIVSTIGFNVFRPIRSGVLKLNYLNRSPSYDKFLMFKKTQIQEINYDYGCHTASPVGCVKMSEYGFTLYHAKYISAEYMLKRYDLFKKRLSVFNKMNKLSYHYMFSKVDILIEYFKNAFYMSNKASSTFKVGINFYFLKAFSMFALLFLHFLKRLSIFVKPIA